MRSLAFSSCLLISLCALFARDFVAAQAAPAKIVLPDQLIAGEPATLAVLTSGGQIAPGSKIVLSNGQALTTDESGRAHFLPPLQTGPLFARLVGTDTREVADVLRKQASGKGIQVEAPAIAGLGDCLAITGSGFEGDADRNTVEISGRHTLVLASSPTQLILVPPADISPGPASLLIREGTNEISANLTFVNVTPVGSPSKNIQRGKQFAIVFLVRGTAQPIDIVVHDLTPRVAQFNHGDTLVVRSTGGPDNSAVTRMKGFAAGQFSYSVSIQDPSTPTRWQNVRDFLQAARKMASPEAGRTIDSILKKLKQKRVRANKVRRELQNIAAPSEPSDFQTLIRAAKRSLDRY